MIDSSGHTMAGAQGFSRVKFASRVSSFLTALYCTEKDLHMPSSFYFIFVQGVQSFRSHCRTPNYLISIWPFHVAGVSPSI